MTTAKALFEKKEVEIKKSIEEIMKQVNWMKNMGKDKKGDKWNINYNDVDIMNYLSKALEDIAEVCSYD